MPKVRDRKSEIPSQTPAYLRSGKVMNSRLNLLSKRIRACRACDLAQTRTHALPGAGNDRARLMIIAQAPGDHEDLEERHFIGPSGRVFDQLLSNARVSRNELFLTNLSINPSFCKIWKARCSLPLCRWIWLLRRSEHSRPQFGNRVTVYQYRFYQQVAVSRRA